LIAFSVILSIPLFGYLILRQSKLNPTAIGWAISILGILIIHYFIVASPLNLMLLYIVSTFLSFKIVVANNHLEKSNQLNFRQWLLFCYTWFGMNPLPFKSFPSKPLSDYKYYLLKGISRIIIGLSTIAIFSFVYIKISNQRFEYVFQLIYLIAISLILHFGLLNISTGILRGIGIPVTSLFKDPIRSKSLEEFWSKRWNIAFVELTTIAALRPIRARYGRRFAFWSAYVFSGLLHEMAISLPVNSGYGKPFAYFIVQAILILTIEKYFIIPNTNKWVRKIWLILCLFFPIFLLFHEAFIHEIVMPLIDYLNVIS
jgi:hypothetical protein